MSSRLVRLVLSAALLAVPACLASATEAPVRPTLEQRRILFRSHRMPWLNLPPEPTAGQDDFDVLDYDLDVTVDTLAERITGRCVVTFVPVSPAVLSEIVLDLHDATLDVTSVVRVDTAQPAPYTHADDRLAITLSPAVQDAGRPVSVAIDYEGAPLELPFGTLTFATHGTPPVPVVFTLAEPFFARGWWPCKDRPDDKATATVRIEAPAELVAVSNGRQVSVEPSTSHPGYAVTTWREDHPIATYLVSIAVSNYELLRESYTSLDGLTDMPVTHWVYPEISSLASRHFAPTLDMMRFFADSFDEYPFIDEKYGHAIIPLGGGMEHQTVSSYGAEVVAGGDAYQFIVAHELAHQWWGDHVGPRGFDSVWLNEGFATYSEALWTESQAGRDAYRRDMRDIDIMRSPPFTDFPGTVHAPPVSNPEQYFDFGSYGTTVYFKGAWVLHMLRWVLGDPQPLTPDPDAAALFAVLREYRSLHGGGVAQTSDFERIATVRTPPSYAPLDQWFFPQWLHRAGRPHYEFGWSAAPQPAPGSHVLHVRVSQVQAEEPFAMPLEIRITMPGGIVRSEIAWNDGRVTDYRFQLDGAPSSVELDPNDWVLKRKTAVSIDADGDGWPDWLDGCPGVPNPQQEDLDTDGVQDACQVGIDYDTDGALNEDDCAPADARAWRLDDALLRVSHVGERSTLSVELADTMGQREYVADIVGGSLRALRENGSIAGVSFCLQQGSQGSYADDLPPLPGGTWYLAFPYNGCVASHVDGTKDPCR